MKGDRCHFSSLIVSYAAITLVYSIQASLHRESITGPVPEHLYWGEGGIVLLGVDWRMLGYVWLELLG